MSALLGKVEIKEKIQKKVELEREILEELKLYMEYNGAINLTENEGISWVVNKSLEYVFNRDTGFKQFKKEQEENKEKNKDNNTNESNSEQENSQE